MSNVISLGNKLDEVITTVKTINLDMVAITEQWQAASELCAVDGYSIFTGQERRRVASKVP